MKRLAIVAAVFAAGLFGAGGARAWGAKGHQYVGALAADLLDANAAAQVRALLGPDVDLAQAAVWADCIRDVSGRRAHGFHWRRSPYTPAACRAFGEDPAERAGMEAYARRNWTTCVYAGHRSRCELAFHFADVAVQHGRYDRSYVGTGPTDVVSAIRAAVRVLQGEPAPAPFHIKGKREALFLLAHFVGDVHQPLHVGAIYLDADGRVVDPDATPGDHLAEATAGGNWLFEGRGSLHHEWDTIAISATPTPAAVCEAASVQPTAGALADRPALWASESVLIARTEVFPHLGFTAEGPHHWAVTFEDRAAYRAQEHQVQQHQLISAGARLAELLNAIWPGDPAALDCP